MYVRCCGFELHQTSVRTTGNRTQAFYKRELLEKQAADDARYERVKRERAYLQAQRKEAAHQVCIEGKMRTGMVDE